MQELHGVVAITSIAGTLCVQSLTTVYISITIAKRLNDTSMAPALYIPLISIF